MSVLSLSNCCSLSSSAPAALAERHTKRSELECIEAAEWLHGGPPGNAVGETGRTLRSPLLNISVATCKPVKGMPLEWVASI